MDSPIQARKSAFIVENIATKSTTLKNSGMAWRKDGNLGNTPNQNENSEWN
jgi:hypothetical protein